MRVTHFILVIYRMPTKPTAGRVAVWRQLKKIGAVYLQQSVCVFPDLAKTRRELQPILERVGQSRGEYHLLPLRTLPVDEQDKLIELFRAQTARQYIEIIENCEVNFQKEIEFETFRRNLSYEEAEEIRIEFEKICNWFDQVRSRDWFDAPHQGEAKSWLERCQQQLEEFEAKVFQVQGHGGETSPRPRRSARRRLSVVRIPPYVPARAPGSSVGAAAWDGDAAVDSDPAAWDGDAAVDSDPAAWDEDGGGDSGYSPR